MFDGKNGCLAALAVAAGILLCSTGTALASPAMIRLGYPTCSACHVSPQGRGLLTDYGKGIDEAESARGGAYESEPDRRRRILQDARLLTQIESGPGTRPAAPSMTPGGGSPPPAGSIEEREWRPLARLWYRNATFISAHQRLSAIVSVDLPDRALAGTAIQPAPDLPRVFLSRMMWEWRPRPGLELAVGRDVLPSGVEIADQATYMRVRNHQGFADVPTQVKLFWWSKRFQVTPYAFGPSGLEPSGFRISGGGLLAETILAHERLVVGLSARGSSNPTFDERLLGVYARTGFGRWAFLSEWDLTTRHWRDDPDEPGAGAETGAEAGAEAIRGDADQVTGFGQVLFYPTRWLITSLAVERLHTSDATDRRVRLRPEISMRLSSNVTVAASFHDQWVSARRSSPTVMLQLFLKTVDWPH